METLNEQEILDFVFQSLTVSQFHSHYAKTVEIADYWRSIISGENQESIILKKRANDTNAQKEESVRLFNTHTPYLTNRLKSVFKKVDKTKRVNKVLAPIEQESISDQAWASFSQRLRMFYQEESLDDYLNTRLIDYATTDPNAYLLIDFFPFDNAREFPVTYPMIFSSRDTILKGSDHLGLQFICFRKPIKRSANAPESYKQTFDSSKTDIQKQLYVYYVYTRNNSYEIIVEDVAMVSDYDVSNSEMRTETYATAEGKTNSVSFYYSSGVHNSGNVPAISLGYVKDLSSHYKINESIYRPAKEVLNEHCEKKSKLDNQMALFGFIRAYFYTQRCSYRDSDGNYCTNGYINDHVCPSCDGTAVVSGEKQSRISRNEFEITEVEIPLPTSGDNGEILDLSRLVHMVEIPENVFKMYQDQVDHLAKLTSLALFNTNIFDKYNNESGAETATGIRELVQSKNNVIHEYAEHKAKIWRFIVDQMLHYFNLRGKVNRNMVFDEDLVPLSDEQIISLISQGKTANVSMEYIRNLESDLMAMKYKDNDDELQWFSQKNKWKPFFNKSENEVLSALSMLPVDHSKKILWLFFEDIFNEIRSQSILQGVEGEYQMPFHYLNYNEQKDVIRYYVEIYRAQLESEEVIDLDDEIDE